MSLYLEVGPDETQGPVDEEPEAADGDAHADEAPADPDDAVRDYLLAHLRGNLSPVIARAFEAYAKWGESIVAQELKVTKAPRKTLAAVLGLMRHRWRAIVVIYDRFDAWPLIEQKTRTEILTALTELRWIVGETGVMGVAVVKGRAPEIEEQFAGAEQVDWSMPELGDLYGGEFQFNAEYVDRWLDASALRGDSPVHAASLELRPLLDACENDIQRFCLMAETAFRDAAERGAPSIDEAAIAAALASVSLEEGS